LVFEKFRVDDCVATAFQPAGRSEILRSREATSSRLWLPEAATGKVMKSATATNVTITDIEANWKGGLLNDRPPVID
jgi:hypothetical protein